MRSRHIFPWSAEPAEERYVIQATVLYEDLEAGHRADALMDCVHAELGLPALLKVEFWEFDSLCAGSGRSLAVSSAGNSAIVVISATNWKTMPAKTESWVIEWLQRQRRMPGALVVLLPQNSDRVPERNELLERLHDMAKVAGVDVFCEFWEPKFKVVRRNVADFPVKSPQTVVVPNGDDRLDRGTQGTCGVNGGSDPTAAIDAASRNRLRRKPGTESHTSSKQTNSQ